MISEIQSTDKPLEDNFFKNFISDSTDCISTFNEYYFWFVEYMASKFSKMGPGQDALEREAYYALLDAACSYKPDEESSFLLFALPIVKERLVNLISDTAVSSLGVKSVSDILYKARNITNRLSNNIRNDSTDWEAANALGIDEDTLNELIYGTLADASYKDLIRKSRESLKKIADAPTELASTIVQGASDLLDEIIEGYEDHLMT